MRKKIILFFLLLSLFSNVFVFSVFAETYVFEYGLEYRDTSSYGATYEGKVIVYPLDGKLTYTNESGNVVATTNYVEVSYNAGTDKFDSASFNLEVSDLPDAAYYYYFNVSDIQIAEGGYTVFMYIIVGGDYSSNTNGISTMDKAYLFYIYYDGTVEIRNETSPDNNLLNANNNVKGSKWLNFTVDRQGSLDIEVKYSEVSNKMEKVWIWQDGVLKLNLTLDEANANIIAFSGKWKTRVYKPTVYTNFQDFTIEENNGEENSETNGYNVTVRTVDKYNRLIIVDYIKVKQGENIIAQAYNCSQIFISNLNGTYTFEAVKGSYNVSQEYTIKSNTVITLRFSNYEQKHRLKVDVTPNDAKYEIKTVSNYGLYTVNTGIGDIDTLLTESGYIIHYSKEGYYDEYYYIYLDNDKDIVINLKAKNQTEIDQWEDYFTNNKTLETGETWFVVKVQVLDKNNNIVTSQTVYVQKAPFGFISNTIGQWNSIAQGVTDANGIATINFTGRTSDWYRLFTQYAGHEYTQGFTPKSKDIVYVTFRLDQSTLSDSPVRSYFNWAGGSGGTAFGNLLGLMPLLVIVIVMSMLLSFVPTSKRRRR